MKITDWVIPLVIAAILVTGLVRRVDIFEEFTKGAAENFKIGIGILPALAALMTAVGMFKASGGTDIIAYALSPLTSLLGFPSECVSLALIRPISGSGSLAVFESILAETHPDSFAGRVASVLMGATETTFYTLAVYFGVTKIKKTRHTLPCALIGDLTGFAVSVIAVKLLFG